MNLPEIRAIIDLRPPDQSPPLTTSLPVVPLSMDNIEEGRHTLTTENGPYLVICERGAHSSLAARYLRADGLHAEAWKGPLADLQQALQELKERTL